MYYLRLLLRKTATKVGFHYLRTHLGEGGQTSYTFLKEKIIFLAQFRSLTGLPLSHEIIYI